LDKKPAITIPEPDATAKPPPQDHQLMPKRRVLGLKPQPRFERRGEDGQHEAEKPDHPASLGDFVTSSTRTRFSVHTPNCFCLNQASDIVWSGMPVRPKIIRTSGGAARPNFPSQHQQKCSAAMPSSVFKTCNKLERRFWNISAQDWPSHRRPSSGLWLKWCLPDPDQPECREFFPLAVFSTKWLIK
jgi:hypothetical protein